MNTFYHINKNKNCNWKVGDEIVLGKEDNYLWQTFADKGESIALNGEDLDVYNVVKAAFDEYTRQYAPPIKMKDYHFKSVVSGKK